MRANDTKSGGASTVLLSIVAVGLAGMVGTIGLIHQVAELGPKVGDICRLRSNGPDVAGHAGAHRRNPCR